MAELVSDSQTKIKLEPFVSKTIAIILAIVLSTGLGVITTWGTLITGVVVGFLVRDRWDGGKYSFLGTFIGGTLSIVIIFMTGIGLIAIPPEYINLLMALLIIIAPLGGLLLGVLGFIGGFLGGLIATSIYANQQ